MEIEIFGENRYANPYLFVMYAVEQKGGEDLIEIFRQCLPYMPRYESGDVIKFRKTTDPPHKETRYVVDRVVNYVIHNPKVKDNKQLPPFQNHIYVIMRLQQLAKGTETQVKKFRGAYDTKMEESQGE